MRKRLFYIIFSSLGFLSATSYSQKNCTVPLPPLLKLVTVQPENGKTDFNWNLSPSTDIAAYIIYKYIDGAGMPIDTLWDPTATTYTYSIAEARQRSVSYVIAAHIIPNCTSPLSNVLNTIFCSSELDTCNKKIIIKWNTYPDYPSKVIKYRVLVSINGSPLTDTYNQESNYNSLTITDFNIDSEYCFVIQAVLEDGSLSNSNKSCLSTRMQHPPQWINADYASINSENKISLSFTIDPISEISTFKLERKTGQSGIYLDIAKLQSAGGKVVYVDNQAKINTVNYYRLSALNSCNNPVTVSNICSNIVLSLRREGDDLNLSWNSYKQWLGNISEYRLFVNTGTGFEEKVVLQPPDTTFKLGYQEIMYNISGSEVCFYLSASEEYNLHDINSKSISSTDCITPTENITVPNVFIPNSGTENAFFKPILSFTPKNYHLVISDRQGTILFETRDYLSKWNGTRNGVSQPQGVFLWFLKVTTPSGKSISKTGTITIINSR